MKAIGDSRHPGFAERSKIYSHDHRLKDVARNPGHVHLGRLDVDFDSIGL